MITAIKTKNLHFAAMTLVGMLIACFCFYPGTLSNDSQWQLSQADSSQYSDMHPPIMSAIWHVLNVIFPMTHGGANLFLYFILFYFVSISMIAFMEQRSTLSRWFFFSLIIFCLPALLILGAVVKDTLMTVNLLFVYALFIYAQKKNSLYALLFALPALFISFCARYNSIFAILPFGIWSALIIFKIMKVNPSKLSKYFFIFLITSVLTAGLFGARHYFDRSILAATETYNSQTVLTFDLVGVSVRTQENCLPPFYDAPNKPITLDLLRFVYRPYTNYYVFWPATPGDPTLPFVGNANQSQALLHYWMKAFKNHPQAMLQHKLEAYFSMLGIMNKFGQLKANELTSPIGIKWSQVSSRMMDGWIYVLLLTCILPFFHKLNLAHRVLFSSSYLYAISWILCTPNTEQRYFSWVIISCTVLIASLLVSKFSRLKLE